MAAVYPPPPPPYSQYNTQTSQPPPPVFAQYNTTYNPPPPPQQQQNTTVVLAQPAVIQPRAFGSCPYCGGHVRKQHSFCGILMAIIFFPLGIVCCFMMMEWRCVSCRR